MGMQTLEEVLKKRISSFPDLLALFDNLLQSFAILVHLLASNKRKIPSLPFKNDMWDGIDAIACLFPDCHLDIRKTITFIVNRCSSHSFFNPGIACSGQECVLRTGVFFLFKVLPV